ncbi:MAG: PEP/pyruvate-binding domain-containing protein [Gammaproteobacteria bacterium]|nr:PEP/pyruvate-binding domain-containing protein [Gammaproteobacteria bacterium]
MTGPVHLRDATEERLFGGKCVSLGVALRAGLPAPDGYALSVELVVQITAADEPVINAVKSLFAELAPAVAVRSSAVGEDSEAASFAGQHVSVLNVMTPDAMIMAIRQVYDSAATPEALAYRKKMGIADEPAIAVVLQQQIQSEISGVMFTRHPLSGDSERYVEASWGLGEAIVAGLVVPDGFRIANDGSIIERIVGEKDIKLVSTSTGEVEEVEVDTDKVEALCLNDHQLSQLHELATACEDIYGRNIDIEWAFHAGKLYLLQCRAITR